MKTWGGCDAVETWYELRHDEPGPVKVPRADSFAARVDCRADVVKEINRGATLHAELPKGPVSGRTLIEDGIAVKLSGKFDSALFEVTSRH